MKTIQLQNIQTRAMLYRSERYSSLFTFGYLEVPSFRALDTYIANRRARGTGASLMLQRDLADMWTYIYLNASEVDYTLAVPDFSRRTALREGYERSLLVHPIIRHSDQFVVYDV